MLFRLVTPNNSTNKSEPGGIWLNTDHIVEVREIRTGRAADDEPLSLVILMVTGVEHRVNVQQCGRGMAETVLAWLQGQEKLPKVEPPIPLDKQTPAKKPELAKV